MLNDSLGKLKLDTLDGSDRSNGVGKMDISENSDIEISTHEWNSKLEKSIQSLGELSLGYKWMHCEVAKDYTTVYDRMMYCSIALGPMVGVINAANQTFVELTIIPLLITIFSFFTGVLAGIIKFCDYENKISNHKAAAARYTSLANNARIQLNLERQDREDPKQYMVWYTTNYGNLFESSPILPDYVMLEWKHHAQKNGFKIPGEVGILMDSEDAELMKEELDELKNELSQKASQIETMKTTVCLDEQRRKKVRLSMYGLGNQQYTDFDANDLARFNNILMKRELHGIDTQLGSSQSSRQNTQRESPISGEENV